MIVAAVLAASVFVVATATAARHYVITRSSQVKAGALSASDLSRAARRSLHGQRGPKGASGAVGPQGSSGPQGTPGPAGVTALTRVDGPTVTQGAFGSGSEVQTSTATCPAGYYATGGGFKTGTIEDEVNYAQASVTSYAVIAVNEFSQANSVTAQVLCAAGPGLNPLGGSSIAASRQASAAKDIEQMARGLQSQIDGE